MNRSRGLTRTNRMLRLSTRISWEWSHFRLQQGSRGLESRSAYLLARNHCMQQRHEPMVPTIGSGISCIFCAVERDMSQEMRRVNYPLQVRREQLDALQQVVEYLGCTTNAAHAMAYSVAVECWKHPVCSLLLDPPPLRFSDVSFI